MWQVYFGDNLSIGIEFNPPSLRFRASSYGVEGCSRLRKITFRCLRNPPRLAVGGIPYAGRGWWLFPVIHLSVSHVVPPALRLGASSCISDAKVLQKTEKKEESERIFSFLMLKELHNYIYQSLIYDFVVMS